MPKPLGLQLYTLRDALAEDFEGTIRKVADMGYAGVEPAGFPGTTPDRASRLFQSLGLAVPGAHIALPLGEKKNEVLDTMGVLGAQYIVCAYLPAHDFQSVDQIKRNCERLNEANAVAKEAGFRLVYHNHWWEYTPVDSQYGYQIMLQYLDPDVLFEVDTYWVAVAGHDPVVMLEGLGERAPLVHVKDGPLDRELPNVAVGEGQLDVPSVVAVSEANAEWFIVELDRAATDMMRAVEKSYAYMVGEGLARGRQG